MKYKEKMTDDEIIELCKTEEGCLEFIRETIKGWNNYYDWCHLNANKIPIIKVLLSKGMVEKKPGKEELYHGYRIINK